MNNKGFTLIELIMVILVLGIIALITVPTVNSIIRNSKEKSYNNQIKLIEDTARTYMSNHSLELPSQSVGSSTCVNVEQLKKDGLLSNDDIINPNYKKNSDVETERYEVLNGSVNISWSGSKYVYEYSVNKCEELK